MTIEKVVLNIVRILLGGSIYYMLETVVRGYSHWSMFILGGVCFLGCGIVNEMAGNSISIWKKMVWCMIIITVFEFLTGIIVNVKLGWHIWDYSGMPLHMRSVYVFVVWYKRHCNMD